MSRYRIDWSVLIDDDLVVEIRTGAGAGTDTSDLRPVLASILRSVGGLPLTDEPWSDTEARTEVRRRLAQAFRCVSARLGARPASSAYVTRDPGTLPFQFRVEPSTPINLNTADRDAIIDLPVFGAALADRVIEERRARGPFTDVTDLAERVAGVGDESIERLRGHAEVVSPLENPAPLPRGGDLAGAIRDLVARVSGHDAGARLLHALDVVATQVAGDPHPASGDSRVRDLALTVDVTVHDAEWIGILWSTEYWHQLTELIAAAQASVDVALFHAALPSPDHPSRTLLDVLVAAHTRGVNVRVLLDADRPSDPYRSTVINQPAFDYLHTAGVAVRFDTPENLLHSKFVVIDTMTTIIGSHNWSAGSFFHYDDTSLVLRCPALAADLTTDFDAHWNA